MTWTTFTASGRRGGRATLRYRVAFESLPYEAVSHSDMVKVGSDALGIASRKKGLKIAGQKITYDLDIAQCRLSAGGITVGLVDIDGVWTSLFTKQPEAISWITADVSTAPGQVISLPDAAVITDQLGMSGMVWIDGEAIYYGSATGTTLEDLLRGAFSSHSSYHYVGDENEGLRSPEVTTWPVAIEGRRVRLYVYGDGDDPQGDGTLIWLGMVMSEPTSNGVMWTVQCDNVVSVLKQTLGADLGVVTPRGILIPETHPFILQFMEVPRNLVPASGDGGVTYGPVSIFGYWESNDEFVADVNTEIAALIALVGPLDGQIVAKSDGADGWHFEFTPGPLAYCIQVGSASMVDGPMGAPGPSGWGQPQLLGSSGPYQAPNITVDLVYYFFAQDEGAGTVPRGIIDRGARIYMSGRVPSIVTAASVGFKPDPGRAGSSPQDAGVDSFLVGAIDSVTGSAYFVLLGPADSVRHWTRSSAPTFRFCYNFNRTIGAGGNSLWDLLDRITTLTPTIGNLGLCPPIYEDEWESEAWAVLSSGAVPPLVSARNYISWSPKPLESVIREELKLAGYMLGVNSSGALTISRLRIAATTEPGRISITSTDILNDSAKLIFERAPFGVWNTFSLQTGWDSLTNSFRGDMFVVRDVAAFSRASAQRVVSSTPFSGYDGPVPISISDIQALASSALGVLGVGYQVLTVDVDASLWDVQIGQTVGITYHVLPSTGGVAEATERTGLVIGWAAELYTPRVTLKLLLGPRDYGGYAPAALISAQTNTSGNTWSLTVEENLLPSGTTVADFLAAGDQVTIERYNTTVVSSNPGVVVSVSGTTVVVTTDAAWTPGALSWVLNFSAATDADLTTAQKRYVFIASATSTIAYASGNVSAKTFGP